MAKLREYTLPDLTNEQWGYFAGFLDADGCLSIQDLKRGGARHRILITQKDRTPLLTFQKWFGVGTITVANGGRRATYRANGDIYNYQIAQHNAVHSILRRIAPLLQVKQGKANFMLLSDPKQS